MWVESDGPGPGLDLPLHASRAPAAELPRGARRELRRRAARAARASACWSSTTTPPTAASSRCRSAKWGMVPRDTESPARGAALARRRASASTSRSSTCTCPRWTASSWRERIRARRPRAAAGAVQLARPARGGRRRRPVRRLPAKPCASRSCSTRWSAARARRRGAAPRRRADGQAAARCRAWPRAIRCASCSPRTTS